MTGAAELERETAGWVHWYNTSRIHPSIGKMAPTEFEEHHQTTKAAPADIAVA